MAESTLDLLGLDDSQEETTPTRPIRLSVSALRDYRRCPRYYKHKRIDKLPSEPAHYLAAGNVVHESFYAGFSEWNYLSEQVGPMTVLPKPDDVYARAETMFEYLWERNEQTRNHAIEAGITPEHLNSVNANTPLVDNFTFGQLKALKNPNTKVRAQAWKNHYRSMLLASLEEFMSLLESASITITAVEQRVEYKLGDIDMLGFIDITLTLPNGKTVLVDLKTGMNKPSASGLELEDQMQSYFAATDASEVWLYHMRTQEIFKIKPKKKFIKSLEEMAEQDALSIEAGFFPKRFDKDQCGRCEFRKVCHES